MEETFNFGRPFGDSFAIQLTGQIMVIAVLVLFIVVVFVIVLQLYARFFWTRTEEGEVTSETRRRFPSHRLVFSTVRDLATSNLRRGLDLTVLSSLPVLQVGSDDFKDGMECAVCLSDIVDGEKARVLPKCNHGFHLDCIDMWFQFHSTCPLCRNVVSPDGSDSNDSPLEVDLEAQIETLSSGFPSEPPNFPTNVLFWGNQREVSSWVTCVQESSSSSSQPNGNLVIDIPNESSPISSSSSTTPSGRCVTNEEVKSPAATRLRSLKRLLSREARLLHSNCTSIDVQHENGVDGKAQS